MEKSIDYVPKLKEIGKTLLSMNEKDLDTQEIDYLVEIVKYTNYMIDIYEGEGDKRPDLIFLGR